MALGSASGGWAVTGPERRIEAVYARLRRVLRCPVMENSELSDAERKALLAQFEHGGRRSAERSEKNPWILGWRAVKAIGDQGLIDDFVRRFKEDEARRYPDRSIRARHHRSPKAAPKRAVVQKAGETSGPWPPSPRPTPTLSIISSK